MKKHLALVLALVMILTSFSFVSAEAHEFTDMAGHENAEAVARLELLNVLKGYPDGTFKPDNTITRAEFAAVAVRVSGLENVAMAAKGLPTGFSDVPAWHWASGYVGTASKMGIVVGIGNGLFAPESPVKYEEAITMIVRALGYEPMAQARGGYPFGYLIVANEIDLLDGAMGTQGTWATRGFVAQITDNALEIPMMIQVGFGSDAKWVISGSDEHGGDEQYLIERMGFDTVEGRVTSYSSSRDTITLTGEDSGTYDVMDGFDFYEVNGVEIKAWVDGDLVIAYKLNETVYFDAVEYDADEEITLIGLDDNFEVDGRADLMLNGESADVEDFDADYAKVVINDDGDVIWAEGFDFVDFIVVEEVDDELLIAFDEFDELDAEDFTIVKDGETIGLEGIMEGDVVFYNSDEEFAVVYNNSEMGVIDRAYTSSFRMDGTIYGISGLGALYLEDGVLGDVDAGVLADYVDEADDVEIFFDFYGDVVLISGSKGTAKTSTMGMILELKADFYQDLRTSKYYVPLEGVNEEGVDVSFDASESLVEDSGYTRATFTAIEVNQVIEYTVDEDGDLDKFATLESSAPAGETNVSFEITDRFAGGFRLKSSTVIFLLDELEDLDEVFTLADADEYFDEVTEFQVFSAKGVYADYIVVYESDATTDSADFGVITRVRDLANGDDYELTMNIAGTSYVFVVDKGDAYSSIDKGHIVSFMINEEMDEIDSIVPYDSTGMYSELIGYTTSGAFKVKDARDMTFTLGTGTLVYELDDAVVLDADVTGTAKTIRFSDVNNNDTVNVYYEGNVANGTVFVKYLVVTDEAQVTPEAPGDVVLEAAYQVGGVNGQIYVVVASVTYQYGGQATLGTLQGYAAAPKTPVNVVIVNNVVTSVTVAE